MNGEGFAYFHWAVRQGAVLVRGNWKACRFFWEAGAR